MDHNQCDNGKVHPTFDLHLPEGNITRMDTRLTRAALYARVSTEKQLDNSSPDSQLERCREYCEKKGYEIVADNRVESISGVFVLARSVFNDYLTMGADGNLDVIVVDIPDRLGRGDAIAKCELLAEMNNCRVEYAATERDTDTVEGYVQHSAEQMVSGIERLNIRRRSKQGRLDWAKKGRVIASAFTAYGYEFKRTLSKNGQKIAVELVIVNEQARIVRQIYTWYVVDGLSVYKITKHLNQQGVLTGRGCHWTHSTVAFILSNETYAGTWHYGKRQVKKIDALGKVKVIISNCNRDKWIPIAVPAIIERDLFDAAQKQKAKRHKPRFSPSFHPFLLRGRIRDICGWAMHGRFRTWKNKGGTTGGRPYYICPRNSPVYIPRCSSLALRADIADELVWEKIRELLKDEQLLFAGLETDRAESQRATRTIQATIAGLYAQNNTAQDKISRWLDIVGDGLMAKEEFAARKKSLTEEIQRRETEIEEWRGKLSEHHILTKDQEAELRAYRATTVRGIDNATFEEKKRYLEWLKIKCVYNRKAEQVIVTGVLGSHTLSLI